MAHDPNDSTRGRTSRIIWIIVIIIILILLIWWFFARDSGTTTVNDVGTGTFNTGETLGGDGVVTDTAPGGAIDGTGTDTLEVQPDVVVPQDDAGTPDVAPLPEGEADTDVEVLPAPNEGAAPLDEEGAIQPEGVEPPLEDSELIQ